MFYWNNRLVNRRDSNGGEDYLQLCEVYYNADDDSLIGFSDVENIGGETIESARRSYERLAEAFNHPVLNEWDFPPPRGEYLGNPNNKEV